MDNPHMLFICNTYMQLITAIQIKTKLYRVARADLILSDHSVNAALISGRLVSSGVFERVNCADTKEICYVQGKWEDAKDVVRLTFGLGSKFKRFLWQEDGAYDLVFYYNRDALCFAALEESRRRGRTPGCVCFEEGIFSYPEIAHATVRGRVYYASILCGLIRKDSIFRETEDFACFYPEIFPDISKGRCLRIPLLNREDSEMLEILNEVFDYHPKDDHYSQKYLFFASSSDIDGNGTGETELVLRIADIVGRENLLVKMHPRDGRHVYEDYGIAVSRNSAIPWEVIQLNHDFSDHVFLSLSSGSVLNASVMLGDEIKTRYLYPLVRKRNEQFYLQNEKIIGGTLRKLKEIGKCRSFWIVTEDLKGKLS